MEKLDLEFIRWSIDARKSIQAAILNLSQCDAEGQMRARAHAARFTELTGVAFSLWRAAFLGSMGAAPLTDERPPNSADKKSADKLSLAKVDHAADLLRTILASNAVGFADDRRTQAWMAEFYIDNASMRLMKYVQKHPPMPVKACVERFRNYASESQVPSGRVSSAFAWSIIFECFIQVLDIFVVEMGKTNIAKAEVLDTANYHFKAGPASIDDFLLDARLETEHKT